jgi:glucosamine--fructose-6-phosphate aminotransferase (isomerizing)
MSLARQEIAQQPDVIARLLERERPVLRAVAAELRRRRPRYVVVAARGSSDNAARYAQHILGRMLRLPVVLATPSLHTLYDAPPRFVDAVVIGISQSGASPDVVSVVAEGARQGAMTVAITNDLAAEGDAALSADLARLPAVMAAQLALTDTVEPAVAAAVDWERLTVVGRGAHYATAFEAALKVRELAGVVAEAYSPADLLHGPIAAVGPGQPLLAVVPADPTEGSMRELVAAARERGARVATIGHDPALGDPFLELVDVPEWLGPAVAIVPAQLLAVGLAERRGVDVDAPFGLSKITMTR